MRRLWLLALTLAGCANSALRVACSVPFLALMLGSCALAGCRPQPVATASPASAHTAALPFAPTATPTMAPFVLTIVHTNDSEGNTDPCS